MMPMVAFVEVFGKNSAVGATYEPVWLNSGAYTFPTSAVALSVSSDSANDDDGGTGVRTIEISGLDANYKPIKENVTMNGVATVTTSQSFLRVNFVKALTVGSGGSSAGDISVKSGATIIAEIKTSQNNSIQAVYTVPATKTLRITDIFYSEDQNKETDIIVYYYETGSNKPLLTKVELLYLIQGQDSLNFGQGFKFNEKTDIYVAAKSAGGAGVVTAGFLGVLA
jgi:hypothetical protein